MHAWLEAPGESCWLQWGGSCVWREIGECVMERWRSRNKKPGVNIVLCCFSLSSDTKPHSQGEARVLSHSFVAACSWGAFRCPLHLLWSSWGCGAALGDVGCLWQAERMWHWPCLWAAWLCLVPSWASKVLQAPGRPAAGLFSVVKIPAAETATGAEAGAGDTGTSMSSKRQHRSLLILGSAGQAEICWCPLEGELLCCQFQMKLHKCGVIQVRHGYNFRLQTLRWR